MRKQFLALALTATLAGCAGMTAEQATQYTVNAATVAASIRYIDKNIDSVTNNIYSVDFYSKEDQVKLDRLFSDVDFIVNRVEAVIGDKDVATAVMMATDVEMLVLGARNTYLEFYTILSKYYDRFPLETQEQLRLMNDSLIALDRAWNEVQASKQAQEITPIIKSALKVMDTGITLVKLGVL